MHQKEQIFEIIKMIKVIVINRFFLAQRFKYLRDQRQRIRGN